MGFKTPNYTQVPNELLDDWMAVLTGAELKVMLVIIRKILGWRKPNETVEPISVSQFAALTGLGETATRKAIGKLEALNLIKKYTATGKTSGYMLVFDTPSESDPLRKRGGTPSESEGVEAITPSESEGTKEKTKEKTKDSAASPFSSSSSFANALSFYLDEINEDAEGFESQQVQDLIADYGDDAVIDAIKTAVLAGKRKFNYVRGILDNRKREGKIIHASFKDVEKRCETCGGGGENYKIVKRDGWLTDDTVMVPCEVCHPQEYATAMKKYHAQQIELV